MVRVTVGDLVNNAAALAVYNSVVPLQVANPMTRPTNVGDIFTEYGYGDTGTTFVSGGGTAGYAQADSNFIKRFQNNTVVQITGNVAAPNNGGIYTEQQVIWNTIAPANNNGQGTSFAGDSGGPYLTSFPSNITITRNGSQVTIPNVLTDFIDAVHVWGTTRTIGAQTVKLNGDQNGGVYINQADYNWIETNLANCGVPEPSSATALLIGSLALLIWRVPRRLSRAS